MNYAELPFRQSYAKVLLTESAEHLKHQLDHGRVATRAMEGGSLFDYLVFGLDQKYEIVDARYKSGDRAGEQCTDWQAKDAQLAAKSCRIMGVLPALPIEIEELEPQAAEARRRFAELAGDDLVVTQHKVRWVSDLKTECEGTPDWMLFNRRTSCVRTVDLKRVASVKPGRLRRQIEEMCWEVQAAAYREAALFWGWGEVQDDEPNPWYGGHTIIACEAEGIKMVRCYRLDAVFMAGGKNRWEKAQRKWIECTTTGEWPGYPEEPLGPSLYYTRTEIETETFATEEP